MTFDVVLICCASSWSETVRKSLIILRLGFGFPFDYTAVGLPRKIGFAKKKWANFYLVGIKIREYFRPAPSVAVLQTTTSNIPNEFEKIPVKFALHHPISDLDENLADVKGLARL